MFSRYLYKLTPHFCRQVMEYSSHYYTYRWVGRGGHQYRPPHSQDCTPFDFLPGIYYVIIYQINYRQEVQF
jgi:hypothetical protein